MQDILLLFSIFSYYQFCTMDGLAMLLYCEVLTQINACGLIFRNSQFLFRLFDAVLRQVRAESSQLVHENNNFKTDNRESF